MLAFYLNNKPFMLNTGTSVRLTWVNPACNFKDIPGDVGMGISIPVNPNNRAMLGHPERFEKLSTENDNEFTGFEVRYSGVILMGGTLVVQSANTTTYSAWLRSNVGNLGKLHREKYIGDINEFAEERYFENKADYDPVVDAYGCPRILNTDFFYDKGRKVPIEIQVPNPDYYEGSGREPFIIKDDETEAFSEAFRKTASYFVNKLNADGTVVAQESTVLISEFEKTLKLNVVSPMLFLNYVIETVLKAANFYIDNNFIADDDDLQKLIIYGNFDITKMYFGTSDVEFEEIEWNGATWEYSVKNYVRPVDDISRDYASPFLYKDLLPQVALKDFILSIQNLLNVFFQFKKDGKVDIIDRETILTNPAYDINDYMLNEWEITEKKDVTLKFTFDHDNDDTIFKERWEDIDDVRVDEKTPVDNLEDLENITDPEMGEVRYIKSLNIYMQYALVQKPLPGAEAGAEVTEDTIGWEHLAIGMQNGFINYGKDEEEEIATKFSSLIGDQTVMTQHRGNINSMKFAYQNFTPRLLFYLGNNIAKPETANISIDWEKENTGLLTTRYPKWSKFWSTRQPVTGKAQLPLNVIDYMARNLYQKYRCDQGEFIIEEMETEFGLNGIGTTNFKGYKIGYTPNKFSIGTVWNVGEMILDDSLIDFTNYNLIIEGFEMP